VAHLTVSDNDKHTSLLHSGIGYSSKKVLRYRPKLVLVSVLTSGV
jgi:hypothetical protein